jgi:hypothetical protein
MTKQIDVKDWLYFRFRLKFLVKMIQCFPEPFALSVCLVPFDRILRSGKKMIEQIMLIFCPTLRTNKSDCLRVRVGAGATFDWLFFDNSKVINFDD